MPSCWAESEKMAGAALDAAPAPQEVPFMGDYHSQSRAAGRPGTLNDLKERMYSLNMRMLLAMQTHDEAAQADIKKQMAAVQTEIDQMCLGSRHRR